MYLLCALLLVVIGTLGTVSGRNFEPEENHFDAEEVHLVKRQAGGVIVTEGTFNQKLDHTDKKNTQKWKQRFYETASYYADNGPVFLFVGGEHAIQPNNLKFGFYVQLASELGAHLILLEHRYFGKSRPVPSLTADTMKYLTIEQALGDIGNFLEARKKNPKYEHLAEAPVITIGCSYPGALAAYARLKFPNLIWGAIASSAPVELIAEFTGYLNTIYEVLNKVKDGCGNTVADAIADIKDTIVTPAGAKAIEKKFDLCDTPNPNDPINLSKMYYNWANTFFFNVQNKEDKKFTTRPNNIYAVCDLLTDEQAIPNAVDRFLAYMKKFYPTDSDSCNPLTLEAIFDYSDYKTGDGKQWDYLLCNELGFFQTTSEDDDSSKFGDIVLDMFAKQCALNHGSKFTSQYIRDQVAKGNKAYGGKNIATTNLILPWGRDDPWYPAMVDKQRTGVEPVKISGAAHCSEVSHVASGTQPFMMKAQTTIRDSINKIVKDYFKRPQAGDED